MESENKAKPSSAVEVKPSLLALVSEKEMRAALQKVCEMSSADKDKYSQKIMKAYQNPLLEIGFAEGSFGYEIAQTILAATNLAIFGRTY